MIALQEAGRYLGLPLVLLMHFDGPTASLVGLLHGLDGDVDADNLARSAMVASLLQSPIPQPLGEVPGAPAISGGIGVSAPHDRTHAVLLLGNFDGQEPPDVGAYGAACLMVAHAADALRRFPAAGCTLTERELECLAMVAAGATGKVAADVLDISVRTFEKLVERARQRLGAKTTPAAAVEAVRRGWISASLLDASELRVRHRYGAERTAQRGLRKST